MSCARTRDSWRERRVRGRREGSLGPPERYHQDGTDLGAPAALEGTALGPSRQSRVQVQGYLDDRRRLESVRSFHR